MLRVRGLQMPNISCSNKLAVKLFVSSLALATSFLLVIWNFVPFDIYSRQKVAKWAIINNINDSFLPDNLLLRLQQNTIIPKILHQTWKTSDNLPGKYAKYRKTWLDMHPNWTHHLWSDLENRELVRLHYPWFLATYDSFPVEIMRADSTHYLQMHRYGGMYADLDMEPLRPLDFLIDQGGGVILGYMSNNYGKVDNVQPGFIASEPGHPLWMAVITRITATFKNARTTARPDYITGPVVFYKALQDYQRMIKEIKKGINIGQVENGSALIDDVRILAPGLIYPFHWNKHFSQVGRVCSGRWPLTQNETACKALFPNSYTIQYSSYSWESQWSEHLQKIGQVESDV